MFSKLSFSEKLLNDNVISIFIDDSHLTEYYLHRLKLGFLFLFTNITSFTTFFISRTTPTIKKSQSMTGFS